MEKLIEGVKKFQSEVFLAKRDLFVRLSKTQEPHTLFVTCSDSRIDPTLLTQTEPDELFILRNAGNIVPSYGGILGGITATIEYAVALLGVRYIIVCRHTDCGAMKALLHPELIHDLPALKNWMVQAEAHAPHRARQLWESERRGVPRCHHPGKRSRPARPSEDPSDGGGATAARPPEHSWVGLLDSYRGHLDLQRGQGRIRRAGSPSASMTGARYQTKPVGGRPGRLHEGMP